MQPQAYAVHAQMTVRLRYYLCLGSHAITQFPRCLMRTRGVSACTTWYAEIFQADIKRLHNLPLAQDCSVWRGKMHVTTEMPAGAQVWHGGKLNHCSAPRWALKITIAMGCRTRGWAGNAAASHGLRALGRQRDALDATR